MSASERRCHGPVLWWVLGGGVLIASIAAAVIVRQAPIPEDAAYIGSAACATCHRTEYAGWHASRHPKMMRRVDRKGVVVADFNAADAPFDPEQAVWAVGSRWEQQFMGHDGKTETLLPGAWLVATGEWKTKGWDGWQVPVPRQRCHGCHTVGLNVETGEFVEPGIGCESCHGPGSWHRITLGLGAITSTLDAQVCGQCHTRGRSPDGRYFFPVGYRPGASLADYFRAIEPTLGQTSAAWWGNGREHKRHQEYAAWRRGGHADSLRHLKEGYDGRYGQVTSDCLRCHAAAAAIHPHREYTLNTVEYGITCTVCHQVHGGLDRLRLECASCHEQGAFYHHPERNADHVVCGDQAKVTCIACHMPLTARNGGGLNLHTHPPRHHPALGYRPLRRPEQLCQRAMPRRPANGSAAGRLRASLSMRGV